MRGTLIYQFCGKRGSEGASLLQNLHQNSHLIPTLELSLAAMINFKDRDNRKQEAFCPELTKKQRLQSWIFSRKEGKLQVPILSEPSLSVEMGFLETPLHPYYWVGWPLPGSQGSLGLLLPGTGTGLSLQSLRLYSPPNTAKPRHCGQDPHVEGGKHCPSTCLHSCRLEKVSGCSDRECTSHTCPSDSVWVASVLSSSLVSQESDQLYPLSSTCSGFRSPSCSVNWPSTPSLGFIYWNHFSWQGALGVVMGRSERGTKIHNRRYFLAWWEEGSVVGAVQSPTHCTFKTFGKTNLHQTCWILSPSAKPVWLYLSFKELSFDFAAWNTRCLVGMEGHRAPDVTGRISASSEESRRGDRPTSSHNDSPKAYFHGK